MILRGRCSIDEYARLVAHFEQLQADRDFEVLDEAWKKHVKAFWLAVAEGRESRNEPPPLVVDAEWEDAAEVVERFNADVGFKAIVIGRPRKGRRR